MVDQCVAVYFDASVPHLHTSALHVQAGQFGCQFAGHLDVLFLAAELVVGVPAKVAYALVVGYYFDVVVCVVFRPCDVCGC